MSIINLKYLAIIGILAITMVAGLPMLWSRISSKIINYLGECDAFARGIFLGAGFTHLLPEAIEKYGQYTEHQHSMLLITSICAYSFALLMWIEKCLPHHIAKLNKNTIAPIFLISALSLHAIIEGYAIGIEHTFSGCLLIIIAVVSHKIFEAAAISLKLCASIFLSPKNRFLLFIVFAIMTPIGIVAGIMSNIYVTKDIYLLEAYSDAIAAGTFIYVATMHKSHINEESQHISVILFILGIALMSVLGHLFVHNH